MKKLFTLLLAAACFTAIAQIEVEYPYNPDNQNDGHVGIEDILEILTVYGEEFTPEQLLVEGTSLTEWIQLLSETVLQQQAQIDSLQGQLSNDDLINSEPWGITLGERVIWNLDTLDWQTGDSNWDFALIAAETDGVLHVSGTPIGYYPYRLLVIPDELLPCENMSQCDGALIHQLFLLDDYEDFRYVDLFAEDDAPPLTIAIKKGERVCLRRSSSTAIWQRFIWTPFIPSATDSESNEGSENQAGPCQGELTVSYHGYEYELVEIGDQCWFAENLRTTSYRNGEAISDENSFLESSSDAWNELNQLSPLVEGEEGHFYSLGVIQSGLDICPSGWSVPSRNDWIHLAAEIDLSLGGHFLKDSTWWNGVDTYGFGAKPTGQAFYQGYDPSWDWQYECSNALFYQSWYQSLQSYLWQTESCIDWEEAVFDPDFPSPCPSLFEEINAVLDSLYTNNIATFGSGYSGNSNVQSYDDLEWLVQGGISLAQPCGSYEEAIELFYGGFDYSYQLIEVGQSTIWWARDASADSYNSGNVRLDGSTRIYGLDSQVDGGLGVNVSIRCIKD